MAVHTGADPRLARAQRALFVRRMAWDARRVGATLELDVALDAIIDPGVRFVCDPGTSNRLVLGPEARVRAGTRLHLHGGSVTLGGWSDVRDECLLNVGGELTVGEGVILSWRTTVHCDGLVAIDEFAGASDGVAIVDSTHYHSDADTPFHANLKRGEVRIGRHVWLGTRAIVLRNTTIGAYATVGAGAVVHGDIPEGHVAIGNPAVVTPRSRPLPWLDS